MPLTIFGTPRGCSVSTGENYQKTIYLPPSFTIPNNNVPYKGQVSAHWEEQIMNFTGCCIG